MPDTRHGQVPRPLVEPEQSGYAARASHAPVGLDLDAVGFGARVRLDHGEILPLVGAGKDRPPAPDHREGPPPPTMAMAWISTSAPKCRSLTGTTARAGGKDTSFMISL